MRRTLLAYAFLLASCPRPQPGPAPLPDAATCPVRAELGEGDVCEGMFDRVGHACVRCRNAAGCVDADLQVYCSAGPCTNDPLCGLEHEDGLLQRGRP